MRLAVVRLQLDRSLKIFDGFSGLVKIVQHESAIGITQRHFGVALESAGIIGNRFAGLPVVGVDVAGNESKIFIVGNNRLVFCYQRERFVVAAQVIQIVGEIDYAFAVMRKLLQYIESELRRFGVVAFQREIT